MPRREDDGIDLFGCLFTLFLVGMVGLILVKVLWEFAKQLFGGK
jgi:hypothetical protein